MLELLGSKDCNPIATVVKVGGSLGQGPATEVTHLGLNQPPAFSIMGTMLVQEDSFHGNCSILPQRRKGNYLGHNYVA